MKAALFLGLVCAVSLAGGLARAEPKADAPKPNVWQVLSDIAKSQSDTTKAIAQNLR